MTPRRWRSSSEEETRSLAAELARSAPRDATFLLYGPMGAGKTVFAQGLAEGLGLDPSEVQSPTFTIVREHRAGDEVLIHLDLYRLEGAELAALAIDEILAGPGVKVVEWADRLPVEQRSGMGYRLALGGDTCREIVEVGDDESESGGACDED